MKKIVLWITGTLLIILMPVCFGQKQIAHSDQIEKIVQEVPDSSSQDIDKLARYFDRQLVNKSDKLRAYYIWLAYNIDYAVEDMFKIEVYHDNKAIISKVLKTRRGICQGYCEILSELCKRSGINSLLISGYSKFNGKIMNRSHSWVAVENEGQWHLFDPTWGAGLVLDGKFIRKYSDEFYMMTPESSIKNRMPFDPVFQFLDYPVSNEEFSDLPVKLDQKMTYFSFSDTLKVWFSSDELGKTEGSCRRIKEAGISNDLIRDYYSFQLKQLEIHKANKKIEGQNKVVNVFNEVVAKVNEAVRLYNLYVAAKNKQFNMPKQTDDEVRKMISQPAGMLTEASAALEKLNSDDPALQKSIVTVISQVRDLRKHIGEEQAFVEKYCNTDKVLRKTLFYR